MVRRLIAKIGSMKSRLDRKLSDRRDAGKKKRFRDMGLPDEIMRAVVDLGFKYCTSVQAEVLPHAKNGRNVAARAQTGTGKTAAFIISILGRFLSHEDQGKRGLGVPRALVIAPTRELVIQIEKDAMDLGKYCDLRTVAIYGGMDFSKQQAILAKKPVDLMVATPGRLLDFKDRKIIDLRKVEVFVIDEADRMLDMGFIPDVRRIISGTPPKEERQTMLFSATLTEEVRSLSSQWMPDPVVVDIEPEQVTVDTVSQLVYAVTSKDKFRVLFNLITKRKMGRTLIFCNRRDGAERLSVQLQKYGIACALLSGAVHQKTRLKILESFKTGDLKIMVATDVAARGLHVNEIDHVVNYDFPYEPESYVHRIGRTGRAGDTGTAISFACEQESFIIPEIEKYIGAAFSCKQPEDDLMEPVTLRARGAK